DQGYATACFGKWHLGWEWGRDSDGELDFSRAVKGGPVAHGFDHFFGIAASLDFPPYVWVEDDQPTTTDIRRLDPEKEGYTGQRFMRAGEIAADLIPEQVLPEITSRTCAFIQEQAAIGQPFYAYMPLPSPHTPILPSAAFEGASGTNAYGDFCLMTDDVVGQVMVALEEAGVAENTILIFTADNGCSPQADFEALAAVGHQPSYHFRGHKADIYEGGHRIPLLTRWPAAIQAGTSCDETVCLADLLATVADIHDVSLPNHAAEDSVSNLGLWRGSAADPVREATVHHSINGSFSIRKGCWKLEFCPGSGGWSFPRPGSDDLQGLPSIQLYDLEADVGERANLEAEHPEIVAELGALMRQYVTAGRSTPGEPQSNTGPEFWPQLEALQV
ncbi:MAG TPA: arylsulfatase, partial [Lentisphaeria bacterium]|nr:arylsulfatase [Lentisphaeria bacterium]